MTVAELIEHLKTLPQDLEVVYMRYSDYTFLEADEITIAHGVKRDKWIARYHRTMPEADQYKVRDYVAFPGN